METISNIFFENKKEEEKEANEKSRKKKQKHDKLKTYNLK